MRSAAGASRAALSGRQQRAALSGRQQRAALSASPRRAIAALAALGIATALGIASLLGADPAPAPAEPRIVPLRVSSGQDIATGFAVADGRAVTVAHVLDGPVTVAGRRVRVIRVDRRNDLVLLSVPGVHADRPGTASAASGEHLRVVRLRGGRSSSLSVHAARSIVAHVRAPAAAEALVRPALELSADRDGGQIAPGDSGAAVVTDSGELAGIVFAVSRNRSGTAYAVDASQLRRLLR